MFTINIQIVAYNGLNRFRGKIISSRVQAAPPWPQALGRLILCSRLIYIESLWGSISILSDIYVLDVVQERSESVLLYAI